MDLRLYIAGWTDSSASHLLLSSSSTEHLQWAFGGTSASTPATSTRPAHTVWTHTLDSLSDDPSPDEGDLFPQPNGDVLELGHSKNPDSGIEANFEELWTDLEARPAGKQDEGRRWSMVWKAKDWGLIVRVGTWCQGIVKANGNITVERWRWCERGAGQEEERLLAASIASAGKTNEETEDGTWIRIFKLGEAIIPCEKTWKIGHQVEDSDWKLEEHYQF